MLEDLIRALGFNEIDVNRDAALALFTLGFIMSQAQKDAENAKINNPQLTRDMFAKNVRKNIGKHIAFKNHKFTTEMAEALIEFAEME